MREIPAQNTTSGRGSAELRSWTTPVRVRLRSASAALRRRLRASLSRLVWAGMALPIAMLVVGCASGTDELTQQIDQMQKEIRELRSSSLAASDRLNALERQAPAMASAPLPGDEEGEDPDSDRPDLQVVRLTPDGAEHRTPDVDASDAAEPEPAQGKRPVVRANQHGGRIVEQAGWQTRRRGAGGAGRPMAGPR